MIEYHPQDHDTCRERRPVYWQTWLLWLGALTVYTVWLYLEARTGSASAVDWSLIWPRILNAGVAGLLVKALIDVWIAKRRPLYDCEKIRRSR